METTIKNNFPALPARLTLHADGINATAQSAIDTLFVDHPMRPARPRQIGVISAIDAQQYANDLLVWEADMAFYKESLDEIREHNGRANLLIEDFLRHESGLNGIPEQYREKIWAKAYADGYGYGYYEVHKQLVELIEIFGK